MFCLCNGSSFCYFSSVKCFKMRLFEHPVSSKARAMRTFPSFPIIITNTLANRHSASGFPIRIRLTCRTSPSGVNKNWTTGVFGVLQRVLPHIIDFYFMLELSEVLLIYVVAQIKVWIVDGLLVFRHLQIVYLCAILNLWCHLRSPPLWYIVLCEELVSSVLLASPFSINSYINCSY